MSSFALFFWYDASESLLSFNAMDDSAFLEVSTGVVDFGLLFDKRDENKFFS